MLAVAVMTIMVVSMTVDAVYHKEQQREEVILHVHQQASDQEGTKFKNPEPATGLQEAPTPDKRRLAEEVIVDAKGFDTIAQIINLQLNPNELQMRTIRTWKYKQDVNVSRIPAVITFADCSTSTCEEPVYAPVPQIVAFAFVNQDGVKKYRVQKKWVPVACVGRGGRQRCTRKKYRKSKGIRRWG